jgi:hypothetical protein
MLPKSVETPLLKELNALVGATSIDEVAKWPLPTEEDFALVGAIAVQYGYIDLNLRRISEGTRCRLSGTDSRAGQHVYEPFNVTTIIACEQTGRFACAIELEPAYVDITSSVGRTSPASRHAGTGRLVVR